MASEKAVVGQLRQRPPPSSVTPRASTRFVTTAVLSAALHGWGRARVSLDGYISEGITQLSLSVEGGGAPMAGRGPAPKDPAKRRRRDGWTGQYIAVTGRRHGNAPSLLGDLSRLAQGLAG